MALVSLLGCCFLPYSWQVFALCFRGLCLRLFRKTDVSIPLDEHTRAVVTIIKIKVFGQVTQIQESKFVSVLLNTGTSK